MRLPRLSEGRKNTHHYLTDGTSVMNALIEARLCGWIVDLRANIGGSMWPMLAVAAPLLPDGVLGHFRQPDGRYQAWSAHRGRIKQGHQTMARSRTHHPPDDHSPIDEHLADNTRDPALNAALA